MLDVQKMIETAKKLGIDVKLNSTTPGFYVGGEADKKKYSARELLLIDESENQSNVDLDEVITQELMCREIPTLKEIELDLSCSLNIKHKLYPYFDGVA